MAIYWFYKCSHGNNISFTHECHECSKEAIERLNKQLACSHEWFLDGDCSDKDMARTYCNKCELIKWLHTEPFESPHSACQAHLPNDKE